MDDGPMTDEDLISRFVAGHRPALGELAARHERALLGLAKGLLGGREDLARDAVQEMWVRVIRFGSTFRAGSKFKTWLYRVLVNQCRSMRPPRVLASLDVQSDAPLADGSSGDASPLRAGLGRATGGSASHEEELAVLRRQVERLTEEKRDVLLLCYHAGMTHETAAEVLEIPVGTLKSRLNAALGELRGRLAMEAAG